MKFTEKQKIAVSKLLQDVMYADDTVTRSEIALIIALHKKLRISQEQMQEARHTSESCYSVIKEMLKVEKEYIANLIHQMIVADGHVDDEELKVYNKFCLAAGFEIHSKTKVG